MRVALVGFFVVAGLMAGVAALFSLWPTVPVWLGSAIMVLLLFGLFAIAFIIFNRRGALLLKQRDRTARIEALEEQRLFAPQTYKAKRAFQVQEFEDEDHTTLLNLKTAQFSS